MKTYMKCILLFLTPTILFIVSCSEEEPSESVNFMISSYHFVTNSYSGETNPSYLLIRSYSVFDSLFGVGAVWGMDTSRLIREWKMEDGFVSPSSTRETTLMNSILRESL